MRKLSHEELVARQNEQQSTPKIPLTVVLNNIRSLYNVGSIFRTADGVGVEKIWLCGITGTPGKHRADFLRRPDHAERMKSQIAKTALGAEESVPWDYATDAGEIIDGLRKAGYTIVLLEQTEESIPYEELKIETPVCLVMGNEIRGVSKGLLPQCDVAVDIEMAGLKNSLNVTVAFGILAYHIRHSLKREVVE